MIFTIEILDKHAIVFLRELEKLKIIRISSKQEKNANNRAVKKEFKATRLDTRGFKFNREEANER